MIDYNTYRTGSSNEVLVLELFGRVDIDSCQFLLDCVEGQIEDGMQKIVVDCSELDYISSMGLGTLVRARSHLKTKGGEVAIAGVQGVAASVFRITHLDSLFQVFPTVSDAVASLD